MSPQFLFQYETEPLTEIDLATEIADGIMNLSFTNAVGDAVYPVKAYVDEKEPWVVVVNLSDGSSFNFALSCKP